MLHYRKIHTEYLLPLISLSKKFEVRNKSDNYNIGDYIWLLGINPKTREYTGDWAFVRIDYILDDESYCKKDKVILSITLLSFYRSK